MKIFEVHDEKDKDFELEISWICPASNYEHAQVPVEQRKAAEAEAKRILEAEQEAQGPSNGHFWFNFVKLPDGFTMIEGQTVC